MSVFGLVGGEVFDSSLAGCSGSRKDDDCWYENVGDDLFLMMFMNLMIMGTR